MQTKLLLLLIIMMGGALKAKPCATNDSSSLSHSGQADQNSELPLRNAFTTEASYTGDLCFNTMGGIQTGARYLGMANLKVGFGTQNAKLWKGGAFFINGAVTHGQSPSEFLIGDFQAVSNMDAGDHIYIHELWYKHRFNKFEITFGLQDLNVEFAASEIGSLFINSSFGIPPVLSDNIPAPVFPLTALGITSKIHITENISLSAAVYDGCPTAFEHNVYNTNWHLGHDDGTLVLCELAWSKEFFSLPGSYKSGYYYHTGFEKTDPETDETTEVFENNCGFYFIADQTVWEKVDSDRSLGIFAQLALSPANINNHHYYVGGGINYSGISSRQPEDAMGMAFACAGFDKSYKKNETTIEAFYKKQIGGTFFIQPDLQYVIHPAGTDEVLPNALVGILRFSVNF
jgi:porin